MPGPTSLKEKNSKILFVRIDTRAFRASPFGSFCTADHVDAFSVDQGIGNLAACLMEIPPCGLAGYAHPFCSLFLLKPIKVDEAD